MAAIEIRLAPGKAPVDLSVRVIEPHQAKNIAPRLSSSPKFLCNFLVQWAEADWRPEPIHSIWLEFDLDQDPGTRPPDPVVCVRLKGEIAQDDVKYNWLPRIHGGCLTPAQQTCLESAWEAIPCLPRYLFSLRSRGEGAIRLEIYGGDIAPLLKYLESQQPRLSRQLADPARRWLEADRFLASLDVMPDGSVPRIGLEASYRRIPRREPGWSRLLHSSTPDPELAEAVLGWSGQEIHTPPHASGILLLRALSHVKVTPREAPGKKPAYKTYLLLQARQR